MGKKGAVGIKTHNQRASLVNKELACWYIPRYSLKAARKRAGL
jgi:hypothetical protein